jgi:hypothetical protein
MTEFQMFKKNKKFKTFGFGKFEFVSSFDIRISDFSDDGLIEDSNERTDSKHS